MKVRLLSVIQAWKVLSPRDRFLLTGLAVFLSATLAFQLLWLPTRQRLASAEHYHEQQLALARQLQSAQPQLAPPVPTQPLSAWVSESAAAAGLDLQQIEVESEQLRLTISGEAQTLLLWLANLEREAGTLQMLTLEKRDSVLEARLLVF